MQQMFQDGQELFVRISNIVESLMQQDYSYQVFLDKEKVIQRAFKYYSEHIPQEEIKFTSDLKLEGFVTGDMMTLLLVEEDKARS